MGDLITKIRYPYTTLNKCSDYKCLKFEYKCHYSEYCIPVDKVCDGINHCLNNDDEMFCGQFFFSFFLKNSNSPEII